MKAHYPLIVAAAESGYERMVSRLNADPDSLYRGGIDDMRYLVEPGTGSGVVHTCCALYACPESRYYRAPELLGHIEDACDMILRVAHPGGTMDLLITNFYTPATFEIQSFARGYKLFAAVARDVPEEQRALARMREALSVMADGCLNGGFHTPNHRWVECGALLMTYNIFKNPALLEKAKRYLSEGIDCDEYGEFTERSVGCYNPINVNSMLVMAEEGNMPELYEYARKNLDLTFRYLEGDGTLFTRNSRRQDRDAANFYPAHVWYYLYLWAGELFKDARYLKFADDMFRASVSGGRGTPGSLWLYLSRPQLKTLEPDLSGAVIEDTYSAYYPKSNIARERKGDFSYTLVANNPDFLHLKFGRATMTLRMCASFFAVAQFAPARVEKTESGYRMTFRGHGEYKGLFPTPPESPDWDRMNQTLRPVLNSCDLDFTVDIADAENGFRMRVRAENTPRVPFKLEFVLPEGTRLETDQVILDAVAGGTLVVKEGDMRLENVETGSSVTVRGLFGEHMYHKDMRGSIPQDKGAFTVYATSFSPVDRELSFEFTKRARARRMRERV